MKKTSYKDEAATASVYKNSFGQRIRIYDSYREHWDQVEYLRVITTSRIH